MGFFDNLLGNSNAPTSLTKEESFVALLLVVVAADGDISSEEVNDLYAIVNRAKLLQDVTDAAFKRIVDKLFRILKKEGIERLIALACDGLPSSLANGSFAIACDLVFSDGQVDRDEVRVLEILKVKLAISDSFAKIAIEVMQAKGSV